MCGRRGMVVNIWRTSCRATRSITDEVAVPEHAGCSHPVMTVVEGTCMRTLTTSSGVTKSEVIAAPVLAETTWSDSRPGGSDCVSGGRVPVRRDFSMASGKLLLQLDVAEPGPRATAPMQPDTCVCGCVCAVVGPASIPFQLPRICFLPNLLLVVRLDVHGAHVDGAFGSA